MGIFRLRLRSGTALALALALCTAPAVAQTTGQATPATASKQATAPLSNPLIISNINGIRDDGEKPDETMLRLALLDVKVAMDGRLAAVELTARIANPSEDTQEARFTLALPDNAVVTGYALDIDGKMIEGVLVDQPKAKAIYEDEVRKNIDPGFAEVKGNKFETRIYPIAPEGSRTITLRFVAPADDTDGFLLPIRTAAAVGQYNVRVTTSGFNSAPTTMISGQKTTSLETSGQPVQGDIWIAGGNLADKASVSRHSNGEAFFQINDADLPANLPPEQKIDRLRLYWDRSLSRRDDALGEELALVEKLAAKARPTTIEVVAFADGETQRRSFAKAREAVAFLRDLLARGGTSFRGLDREPTYDTPDLCLLFSDGAPSVDVAADFEPECRLSAITSAADANLVRLGRWAGATRGQVFRLAAGEQDRIITQLLRPAVAVVDVRNSAGQKLPFRALPAEKGWRVVGPMPDSGPLTVSVAGLGKGLVRRSYSPGTPSLTNNDAAGALWAVEKLERLADDPRARDDMRRMAVRYKVASPGMAFLVLERPDQYLKAEIEPPNGFSSEWLAEYREMRDEQAKDKADARSERFDQVLEEWNKRKTWWARRFDPPKTIPDSRKTADSRSDAAPPPVMAEPAPPPPPPAPEPIAAPPPNQMERAVSTPAPAAATVNATADAPAGQGYADDLSADIIVTSTRIDGTPSQSTALTAVTTIDEDGEQVEMDVEDVLSDLPYLTALDKAKAGERMKIFAEQEKTFGHLPAFYLDTSEWFRLKGGDKALADTLMLSALDLPTADDETRQIVAFRLLRDGKIDLAIPLLEQIAASTEFRPQPKRQLALALAQRGQARGKAGLADLERAFKLLTEVALDPADSDFDGIEVISLMEANALIPTINALGGKWTLDPRLVGLLDTDVRILIEWTNDDADLDLHVIEPSKEEVYYGNKESLSGGLISNDMTDGYGPEEYTMRRAVKGNYTVRIHGYSPDRLNPNGMGRVMVRLIRNFGRPNQQEQLIDADISFDRGADRDGDGKTVSTMKVGQ